MSRFEQAVAAAIDSIPAQFAPYLENVEFVVAARSPGGELGRYEGGDALSEASFPARVILYKDAHEEASDSWQELADEVRRTVLHEVGHHFQMEEDELPY